MMKRRSFIKGSLGAVLMLDELLPSSQYLTMANHQHPNASGEFEEILDGFG